MTVQNIAISDSFRQQAKKAIFAIVLFVIVFLILIALAVVLTIVGIFAAIQLVLAAPGFWTLLIGLGLASVGFLVVFFLLKFLFKKHKTDRSEFIEINRQQEPRLFALLDDIVKEVGTSFPKHVYLSHDVNAAVFFDSNFWSMFLPIKKNLIIGLGLVNTVSDEEFKAILAHEFGHFSQNSMKVGSYVYNANQIIHNMLYDNDGFHQLASGWASIHGLITLFVIGAVRIVQAIQWVLGHMYNFINLSYMSLSREMEFHADEVAAHVSGSEPMSKALLRLDMCQEALNMVLNFYSRKIDDQLTSQNIYAEQLYTLHFLAKEKRLSIEQKLPQVTVDDLDKFNHSKLVIDNQWASHPSTADRVAALQKLSLEKQDNVPVPANELFVNITELQQQMTRQLFKIVVYSDVPTDLSLSQFNTAFKEDYEKGTFAPMYHGYYDNYNIQVFPLDAPSNLAGIASAKDLFTEQRLDLIYQYLGLETDLLSLAQIATGNTAIRTFDYAGRKYRAAESKELLTQLEAEHQQVKEQLAEHDQRIFTYFHQAATAEQAAELKNLYAAYFTFVDTFDKQLELHHQFSQRLQFVTEVTPEEQIIQNLKEVAKLEELLKEKLSAMLYDPLYMDSTGNSLRKTIEEYLSRDLAYFVGSTYVEDNLQRLFTALAGYQEMLGYAHFMHRKRILDFQAKKEKGQQ